MSKSGKIKEQVKQKAQEIATILQAETQSYHGKVEIVIRNGVAINVNQTESIDMK
jgi:hypothetical protein